MKKYIKLLLTFFQNDLVREMEFRGNFFLQSFIGFCWIGLNLAIVFVFYQFTTNIIGWSLTDAIVLVGIHRLIKGLFDTFFRRNLFYLPENIGRGDLDYSLTKPVNSLFLLSTRYQIFSEIPSVLSGTMLLWYAFGQGVYNVNLFSMITLFGAILVGLVAYYSLFTSFITLAIFTVRLTAIADFHEAISQTIRFPTDFLSRKSPLIELLLIPVSALVTFPTKIFLGSVPSFVIAGEVATVTLMFLGTVWFWNFALRHYSSASS